MHLRGAHEGIDSVNCTHLRGAFEGIDSTHVWGARVSVSTTLMACVWCMCTRASTASIACVWRAHSRAHFEGVKGVQTPITWLPKKKLTTHLGELTNHPNMDKLDAKTPLQPVLILVDLFVAKRLDWTGPQITNDITTWAQALHQTWMYMWAQLTKGESPSEILI